MGECFYQGAAPLFFFRVSLSYPARFIKELNSPSAVCLRTTVTVYLMIHHTLEY